MKNLFEKNQGRARVPPVRQPINDGLHVWKTVLVVNHKLLGVDQCPHQVAETSLGIFRIRDVR